MPALASLTTLGDLMWTKTNCFAQAMPPEGHSHPVTGPCGVKGPGPGPQFRPSLKGHLGVRAPSDTSEDSGTTVSPFHVSFGHVLPPIPLRSLTVFLQRVRPNKLPENNSHLVCFPETVTEMSPRSSFSGFSQHTGWCGSARSRSARRTGVTRLERFPLYSALRTVGPCPGASRPALPCNSSHSGRPCVP